jgi:hypothetical protein
MSYLAVGSCCSPEQMATYGRTGTTPTVTNFTDMQKYLLALKDPVLGKVYRDAQAAAAKTAVAKAQTEANRAQAEADASGGGATVAGGSTKTWLLVGGGLAALAGLLVVLKKKWSAP